MNGVNKKKDKCLDVTQIKGFKFDTRLQVKSNSYLVSYDNSNFIDISENTCLN